MLRKCFKVHPFIGGMVGLHSELQNADHKIKNLKKEVEWLRAQNEAYRNNHIRILRKEHFQRELQNQSKVTVEKWEVEDNDEWDQGLQGITHAEEESVAPIRNELRKERPSPIIRNKVQEERFKLQRFIPLVEFQHKLQMTKVENLQVTQEDREIAREDVFDNELPGGQPSTEAHSLDCSTESDPQDNWEWKHLDEETRRLLRPRPKHRRPLSWEQQADGVRECTSEPQQERGDTQEREENIPLDDEDDCEKDSSDENDEADLARLADASTQTTDMQDFKSNHHSEPEEMNPECDPEDDNKVTDSQVSNNDEPPSNESHSNSPGVDELDVSEKIDMEEKEDLVKKQKKKRNFWKRKQKKGRD